MISVVIPTLNAEAGLAATLSALVRGSVQGLVREVIIADGGSRDATADIAEVAGARFLRGDKGRGSQLAAGAEQARSKWLLFLHGDTVLQPGWEAEARAFMARVDGGARPEAAATEEATPVTVLAGATSAGFSTRCTKRWISLFIKASWTRRLPKSYKPY